MLKKVIRLARTLALAIDRFVTGTQLIVAQKRSGKSYAAQVEAEDLLEARQQIIVIDPTSAWSGLRSSADGKSPGYPITIFGGKHGDAPLDIHSGKKMAQAVVDGGFSVIFDLSQYDESQWATFCADFLAELYKLNTEAVHLFIDEADVCAPQNPGTQEQHRALRAANSIIRRGGIKGIGCTLITQRAALINKDLASQVDQLVILRMNHHLDIDSTARWVSKRTVDPDERERMIDSLPSLQVGEAYVWNPVQRIFERVQIRAKRTFDSGRTPRAGERKVQPKALAKVDAAKLGAEIAASIERAKENDPAALRAELAKLRAELAREKAKPVAPAKAPKPDRKGDKARAADIRRMEVIVKKIEKLVASILVIEERHGKVLSGVRVEVNALADAVSRVTKVTAGGATSITVRAQRADLTEKRPVAPVKSSLADTPYIDKRPPKKTPAPSDGSPPKIVAGLRRIMIALAQRPQGLTYRQIGVRAGISTKGGTFSTYMSRARQEGWIVDLGETRKLTEQGAEALGHYDPLPQGSELADYWMRELGGGAARMLKVLIDHHPEPMDGEKLGELAKVSHAGGTFSTYLSKLRGLELVSGTNKALVAADEVCP